MQPSVPSLYQHFHVAKGDERLSLFKLVAKTYTIDRVLYPGCFVHITPSFVFPSVVYVEVDKRAKKFFADPTVYEFIAKRQAYPQPAHVRFHSADYTQSFPEPDASFALLISQFAGFVSHHCHRYLRMGGLLLANDSHGDASLAAIDPAYELVAVISHSSGRYRLTDTKLETYFVPKSKIEITASYLFKLQRGVIYQKTASAYVFRRVQ